MPVNVSRANGAKSKVRAAVEHVFARQKGQMGLVVRTIGIARATVKIGLANMAYNMRRAVWLVAPAARRRTNLRDRRPERRWHPEGAEYSSGLVTGFDLPRVRRSCFG